MREGMLSKSESIEGVKQEIESYLDKLIKYKVSYDKGSDLNDDENVVNALDSSSWRCVDGRYTTEGSFAFPGGSLGLFLTTMAILKESGIEESEYFVQQEFERVMGPLTYHSDDHTHDSDYLFAGCGHAMSALQNPEKYSLDFPLSNLNLAEDKRVVLTGDHKEQAVVIFAGEDDVELPSGYSDKHSFFAFHRGVAVKTINHIIAELAPLFGESFDKANLLVEKMVDLHANTTLAALSKKMGTEFVIISRHEKS